MIVVERVHRAVDTAALPSGYRDDAITLTWEDRRKRHGRRTSDSGLEFAISLPAGPLLSEGDCFVIDDVRTVVRVREAHELVFVIRPETPEQSAYVAYQIGNRHQPLMITTGELICPREAGVQLVLDRLHISYASESRPFTPVMSPTGHTH